MQHERAGVDRSWRTTTAMTDSKRDLLGEVGARSPKSGLDYVGYDGKHYLGQPPADWLQADDGTWWPLSAIPGEVRPPQTSTTGCLRVVLVGITLIVGALIVLFGGLAILGGQSGSRSADHRLEVAYGKAGASCSETTLNSSEILLIGVAPAEAGCVEAAAEALAGLGFSRTDAIDLMSGIGGDARVVNFQAESIAASDGYLIVVEIIN